MEALTSRVRRDCTMPGGPERLASAVAACDHICSPRWYMASTARLVLTG